MLAGAGPAGHNRATNSPARQFHLDLYRRVAATVQDLAPDQIDNLRHDFLLCIHDTRNKIQPSAAPPVPRPDNTPTPSGLLNKPTVCCIMDRQIVRIYPGHSPFALPTQQLRNPHHVNQTGGHTLVSV